MNNYDELIEISHKPNQPYISNHPYNILIIGGSRSGKANVLLNQTSTSTYWQNLFICQRST